MTRLYLDHNATSPLRPEARKALEESLNGPGLGNPSSAHAEGRRARATLEEARERLASLVGAKRDELIFTSGGTEANGLAMTAAPADSVIICSPLEHPSVLEAARGRGILVSAALDTKGHVRDLAATVAAHGARLVSVARANHEIGLLQDLGSVSQEARASGALCHSDASQALGRLPVDMAALGVDLLTLSSHKLGGPVGIGALIVRSSTPIQPLLRGGGQEGGWRAGTEAVVLARAFAAAAEASVAELGAAIPRWRSALSVLRQALPQLAPEAIVHTPQEDALPQTLNISFPGRSGASLVHRLDLEGVSVSHGSACSTGSLEPSPVLLALGLDESLAGSSVRISLGHDSDVSLVREFIERLATVLAAVPRRNPEEKPRARETTNE